MSSNKTVGIYWFNNDLRLHDNPGLTYAADTVDQLYCVYCIEPRWFKPNRYNLQDIGPYREKFLWQSLHCLGRRLKELGQKLYIIDGSALYAISSLLQKNNFTHIFSSHCAGWYENEQWRILQKFHPDLSFNKVHTHTLFTPEEANFSIEQLPDSFTQFKKLAQNQTWQRPILSIQGLPEQAELSSYYAVRYAEIPLQLNSAYNLFQGGEVAALKQLETYFDGKLPTQYKETRNKLDGWDNSCKLSTWLANGSLSVRHTLKTLNHYEQTKQKNESTDWIYNELLWREYFQWYAHKHQKKLFSFKGLNDHSPLTSFYPQRFQQWCQGTTPFPIVNACMHQLNETGYLSNRGRQLVASCLVNELSIDWRYGAAYFEQMLIDYDVASNWGNWQYIAGVSADTHPNSHVNLEKETEKYDPQRKYINTWRGNTHINSLDSVDAADWPIKSETKT